MPDLEKNKILLILGPTASGKSDLAVDLAKKFNGEIISADSQQVYKGLDVGSGKITKKEMRGIPHYLLDVVTLNKKFTVAQFKKLAEKAIADILKRGKLPIVVGGTGFYIQAIVDDLVLPEVKPDKKLRRELEKKTTEELFEILKKLDSERAKNIDSKNPRRLVRAIEIATHLGSVPEIKLGRPTSKFLQIGIKTDDAILKKRIADRFVKRMKKGIVSEAKKLHEQGVSWERFMEIGLAHKYMEDYVSGKMDKKDFIDRSIIAEQQYAKKQMTWFKRDERIKWFELEDKNLIEKEVFNFINF